MSDVRITFTSDDKDVIASLTKMQKEMVRLREEAKKLKEEGRAAAKQMAQETREAAKTQQALTGAVTSTIAQYASAAGAVMVVNRLLQDQVDLQREIAGIQTSTAGSQRTFLHNLGVVSPAERQNTLSQIASISQRTGVKQNDLFAAGSIALSSKGAMSNAQALEAVELAARAAPDNAAELGSVAGAMLDLASLTGDTNAKRNLGFMTQVGEQAHITSLDQIAQTLVPSAIGVKGFGGTAEESAALVSTMTQAMKDRDGRVSGTASIQLAKQLAEFLPTEDRFTFDERGRKKLAAKGTGLTETDERIRFMQEHPELRERFLAGASFEQRAIIPARDLLTKGTEAAGLFDANAQSMTAIAGTREAAAEELLKGIESVPIQQTADFSRRVQAITERASLQDASAARKGNVWDLMDEANKQIPGGRTFGLFNRLTVQAKSALTGQPVEDVAATQLERQAEFLETSERNKIIGKPDPSIEVQVRALREMVQLLRSIDQKQGKKNIDAHTE